MIIKGLLEVARNLGRLCGDRQPATDHDQRRHEMDVSLVFSSGLDDFLRLLDNHRPAREKNREPEPPLPFITHHGLSILAFFLGCSDWFQVGPLGWALWPQARNPFLAGAAITFAGLGFAIWARFRLGQNWSSSVALKEGHQLIQTGPYALVRHPIYTGIITGLAGTDVAIGEVRGVLAVALLTAVYIFKYRREEILMRKAFGDEYVAYARVTGGLLPTPGTLRKHPGFALAALALAAGFLWAVVFP